MKALAVVALACAGTLSNAIVLIGNYPPTNDTSTTADVTTTRNKALGFVMPNTSYFLDSVTIRLLFTSTATTGQQPVLTIRDTGTATSPGATLFTLTAPGGYVTGAGDYTFTAGSAFTLNANQKYWLVLTGATTVTGMSWRGSSPAITPTGLATHQGSLFTTNAGTSWSSSATLNTYQINVSSVPEPATLAAVGLGVAALLRRRKK